MSERLPASARKREQARRQGQVAVSPRLSTAAAFTAAALVGAVGARGAVERVVALGRRAWGGALAATPGVLAAELWHMATALLLPLVLAALGGALLVGLAQTRGLFAFGALGRRWRHAAAAPAIGWALGAALALAGAGLVATLLRRLAHADGVDASARVLAAALVGFAPRALTLLAAGGLAEWAWRRAALERALAMTRAERERERRDAEGDPRLRAEQRRRQRALGHDPLVDEVARAELVLVAEGVAVAVAEVDGLARVTASAPERLRAVRLATIARRLGRPLRADAELAPLLAELAAGAPVPPAAQERVRLLLAAARRRPRAGSPAR